MGPIPGYGLDEIPGVASGIQRPLLLIAIAKLRYHFQIKLLVVAGNRRQGKFRLDPLPCCHPKLAPMFDSGANQGPNGLCYCSRTLGWDLQPYVADKVSAIPYVSHDASDATSHGFSHSVREAF